MAGVSRDCNYNFGLGQTLETLNRFPSLRSSRPRLIVFCTEIPRTTHSLLSWASSPREFLFLLKTMSRTLAPRKDTRARAKWTSVSEKDSRFTANRFRVFCWESIPQAETGSLCHSLSATNLPKQRTTASVSFVEISCHETDCDSLTLV